MSVVFFVTPVLITGWPTFCAAAAAAASTLGYRVLKSTESTELTEEEIELSIEKSEVVTDQVQADDEAGGREDVDELDVGGEGVHGRAPRTG